MQFTSTFPSHGQMIQGSTLEGDTETQGFKRRENPSTREAQDEKCCREGLGVGGKGLRSQNRRKGRAREKHAQGRLQALPLPRGAGRSYCHRLGVRNTSSQHRGGEQGRWESVGCPEPNPAGYQTAPPGPPAQPSPEPHKP
uniref:Uncharacterized protein n=1 Tax=Pipistrellus kuhlii TaxID=59472 RepID=A0A7J7VV16_PIPKU|nr:hypothetical protein mPipKuh1_008255 [Pipistrellus kuhlii]